MSKITQFLSSLFPSLGKQEDGLSRSKDFVQRLIGSETEDLRKLSLTKIPQKISVFEFRDSSIALFISELNCIKNKHLTNCNSFKIHLKRYLDFVLLEGNSNKIMETVEKRELEEEMLKLNQLRQDQPELLTSEIDSVKADIASKIVQAEALKADDFLKLTEMKGTSVQIAHAESLRLKELASENPKKALQELEYVPSQHIPEYPAAPEFDLNVKSTERSSDVPDGKSGKKEGSQITKPLAEFVSKLSRKFRFELTKPVDDYTLLTNQMEKQMAFGERFGDAYNDDEPRPEEDIKLERNTAQAIHIPAVKESSTLANVSAKTTFIVNAISFLATIPEVIIMAKAVSFIFHVDEDGWEFWFMGLAFPLFSKLNSILLIQPILKYFKRNGQLFRIKNFAVNRLTFAVFLLSFLYCIGISNLFLQISTAEQITQKFVLLKKESVSIKKEVNAEDAPASASGDQQVKDNEEKLNHLKSKVFAIEDEPTLLQKLVISITMATTLLCSSLLTAIGFVMGTSLHLRRKLEKTADKISDLQEQFDTTQAQLSQFRTKVKKTIMLHFELEYLNRLSDNNLTPEKTLYKAPTNGESKMYPMEFPNHNHKEYSSNNHIK